jgi:D,D-heptose 1,7-bisphosphate phosphatase
MKKNKAVFLDRDGVINDIIFHQEMGIIETPFTVDQFKIKKGVAKAIQKINKLGYKVIVASNQPGLAIGNFTEETLLGMTGKMISEIKKDGGHIDDIFYCIHHPKKGTGPLTRQCACRKPKPGLLRMAAKKHNIDLKKSYMIGDSITDVEAGLRAGCKTILLAHLKCDLCHLMAKRGIKPHFMANNLQAAAKLIRKLR